MGNTPNVRFKGFTEDWEQRKLGELAEIVGGGTPSTSVESYWDGDIDWYAPAEIGEQIYLKSSQRKITEEGLNKSSAKVLPVGTVLFTSRAGIGKTAILLKEGCTNQGFQSIVPNKDKLDSYFIFTRSEELKRYGEAVGAGSTFVEVSGKQMANMELMMPTTMDEQQQIGEYFQSLDHLITLHQQKCDETKEFKKYMLQNMFPQKDEKVPKIRFAGFTGDWEQRKLGELLDFHNGFNGSADRYGTGIPLISVMDILNNDFITSENIRAKAELNEIEFERFKVEYGDVLFQRSSENIEDAGTSNVYMDKDKRAAFGGFVICGKKKTDYNPLFMKYGMTSKKVRIQIMSKAQGAQHINVSQNTLQGINFFMPSQDEQDKIGAYFSNLDNLITLHQQKCNALKEFKKYMLQNMFPQKGENKCQN